MATYSSVAELLTGMSKADQGLYLAMVQSDSILARIPVKMADSGLYEFTRVDVLPSASFRKLGVAGSDVTFTPNRMTGSCQILHAGYSIDNKVIQRASDPQAAVAAMDMMALATLQGTAEYYMIHGDPAASTTGAEFAGWKALAEANSATVSAGTDGGTFALDDFMSMIEMARKCAGGDSSKLDVWMNSTIHYQLWVLLNASSTSGVRWTMDQAGMGVQMFDGVRINVLRESSAGDDFLPFTEEQGSSGAVCCSVYCTAISRGDGDPGLFFVNDGAPLVNAVPTTIGKTVSYDWGVDQNVSHKSAVVRYKGIKAA